MVPTVSTVATVSTVPTGSLTWKSVQQVDFRDNANPKYHTTTPKSGNHSAKQQHNHQQSTELTRQSADFFTNSSGSYKRTRER